MEAYGKGNIFHLNVGLLDRERRRRLDRRRLAAVSGKLIERLSIQETLLPAADSGGNGAYQSMASSD